MKSFFQNILSIFLAVLVLFSTFSFTVHKHYCGDELKDVSVFFEAEKCEMEKVRTEAPCELHQNKKTCCDDVIDFVEGQDELKVSIDPLSLDQQLFIASFVYTYTNLFNKLEEKESIFTEYPPPLIIRQLYKLDESYLI